MVEKKRGLFRGLVQQVCPPIAWSGVRKLTRLVKSNRSRIRNASKTVAAQDLDVYWDAEMAQLLEIWGEKNVWKEIQLLMVNCQGKVLDIACGTGRTMEVISKLPLDIHGCDISGFLIGKAIERGIQQANLTVCDATKMPFASDCFDYAYSIGSMEHFTEEGVTLLLEECHRTVRKTSFHIIPV